MTQCRGECPVVYIYWDEMWANVPDKDKAWVESDTGAGGTVGGVRCRKFQRNCKVITCITGAGLIVLRADSGIGCVLLWCSSLELSTSR